jgi:hypothetical protein
MIRAAARRLPGPWLLLTAWPACTASPDDSGSPPRAPELEASTAAGGGGSLGRDAESSTAGEGNGGEAGSPPSPAAGGSAGAPIDGGPIPGSTGGTAGTGGTGSLGQTPPDCCQPSSTPGCSSSEVTSCVCAADSLCCSVAWDEQCVGEVGAFGCGDCGPSSSPGTCCTPHSTPGCSNAHIQECVCDRDPLCCRFEWDSECVEEIGDFGCGACR